MQFCGNDDARTDLGLTHLSDPLRYASVRVP